MAFMPKESVVKIKNTINEHALFFFHKPLFLQSDERYPNMLTDVILVNFVSIFVRYCSLFRFSEYYIDDPSEGAKAKLLREDP